MLPVAKSMHFKIYSGRKFARKRGHFCMQNLFAVVLAAGKGTRMRSKKHKVLHEICGKPMIDHILTSITALSPTETILVVGHQGETVRQYMGDRVQIVEQHEQLGTAHAVQQTRSLLENQAGITLVLNGDHPLFTAETFQSLIEQHQSTHAAATVLTAKVEDPTGYGRIVRGENGSVSRIVEHKDATEEERQIQEINTGTFCFDNEKLFAALQKVNNDNAQGEYYLPDVLSILQEEGEVISAYEMEDVVEAMGVNDRIQLAEAAKCMRKRIILQHMQNGVTIVDPDATYIDIEVVIGEDTVIEPGTFLRGKTVIGADCHIGPQADLTDVTVLDSTKVQYTVAQNSHLGKQTTVGPFAYLRPGTDLGQEVKIGCFVDLKKAKLAKGAKVSHLAYVGDAEVGKDVNVGCGVVTVNYDGFRKHKTVIEDGVFIGCNTNLVAPVTVEQGAYVAAGSTITKDVPADALAVARERQVNKEGYVPKLKARLDK